MVEDDQRASSDDDGDLQGLPIESRYGEWFWRCKSSPNQAFRPFHGRTPSGGRDAAARRAPLPSTLGSVAANFLSEPVARQVVCEKAFGPRDNLRMPGSHSFSYQAEEKNRRPSELSMEDIDTDHLMRREAGVPNPQRPFGRLLPTARFVERPLAT